MCQGHGRSRASCCDSSYVLTLHRLLMARICPSIRPQLRPDVTNPACCCTDLVVCFGYPLEKHTVRTSDGYLLGLFRIAHGGAASNEVLR